MPTPRPVRPADAPALLRDERTLVDALRAGDPGATRLFLEHTHAAAYAFACRWTPDPEQRADWAHTALLVVLSDVRAGRFVFRHPGGFWSWFRKRAGFLMLDQCRRARRHARREGVSIDDLSPERLAVPDGAADPAVALDRAALRTDVERCLERVASPDHRAAIRLLLEQELSYDDIAAALGSSASTVRNWIHRARVALRRCLLERWGLAAAGPETTDEPGPSWERP